MVKNKFYLKYLMLVCFFICFSLHAETVYDPKELPIGGSKIIYHNGFPVYVVRRTPVGMGMLPSLYAIGKTIKRVKHDKPAWWNCDTCLIDEAIINNSYRSIKKEIFVAYAVSPYFGCQINYIPSEYKVSDYKVDLSFLPEKWHGGFVDSCSTVMFDMAGRPLFTTYLQMNMLIPPYVIRDDGVVVFK